MFVNELDETDIDPLVPRFPRSRIEIELLDQSNIEDLVRLGMKHGPFDIIVEDGSHRWDHQITILKTLFPFLRNGGLYVVEDLQTNFGSLAKGFQGVASISFVEYLKKLVDLRVADDQIDINKEEDAFLRTYGRAVSFITFYRRACLIEKSYPEQSRQLAPDQALVAIGPDADYLPVGIRAPAKRPGWPIARACVMAVGRTGWDPASSSAPAAWQAI